MEIVFRKKLNGKNIISYKRKGFKEDWIEADNFLVLHDLGHYIIETTLKFNEAFFGLIKRGAHPRDFEDKAIRNELLVSNEAWYAECMANLFLMEYSQGHFENFNEVLLTSLRELDRNIPELKLESQELDFIRIQYSLLIEKWKSLATEDFLTLEF